MDTVVEIENLSKDFPVGFWRKRPIRALDNLCLQVRRGEIFGFLGPNGAGKSTTIKILMHLLHPTSGRARILGESVDNVSMHHKIGYLPENPYFYDYLTPAELLTYMGRLFGLGAQGLSRKVDSLLESVGLAESRNVHLRKFSKGMVQRIGIAQALINDPEIVFLDEPMSGLDPLGRMEVRRIITSLKARQVTVFFSSHVLPDVEALCDRIAILNKGRLQEMGRLEEILNFGIDGYEVILSRVTARKLEQLQPLCREVRSMENRLHLRVGDKDQVEKLLKIAFEQRLELISVNPIRHSLEEHFSSVVNRQSTAADEHSASVSV